MLINPPANFVDNYMRPIARYQAVQFVYKATVEIVKVVAAKVFLEFISKRYLNAPLIMPFKSVYETVVLAPLLEEILFRFLILKSIHLFQELMNMLSHKGTVDDEKKLNQQIFRVHFTALIFGLVHLTNPHKTAKSAAIQVVWSALGGEVYGNMAEKYHSIFPSILSHALNNAMVCVAVIYQVSIPLFVASLIVNRMALYLLSRPSKPAFVPAILSHAFNSGIFALMIYQETNPSAIPLLLGAMIVNRMALYFFFYRSAKLPQVMTKSSLLPTFGQTV